MQGTLKNRTIFCRDNIEVLRGIDSNTIDLVYLDPPFNKNKNFHAPIGSASEGASFKDTWGMADIKDEWHGLIADSYPLLYQFLDGMTNVGEKSNKYYLIYMGIRLLEIHRVLKDTGSMYLHCDGTMSHYLKILCDIIFGQKNYRNEIIWKRSTSQQKGSQFDSKTWARNTDTIFCYTKSNSFELKTYRKLDDVVDSKFIENKFDLVDGKGRRYYDDSSHIWRNKGMGERPNLCYKWRNFKNPFPSGWRLSKERLEEEYQKGNIVIKENGKLQRRKYKEDYKGVPIGNLWDNINPVSKGEYIGYPTQKPLELLNRIIQASSNEGDIILDPFCGCATACISAELNNRQWIGIDVSKMAFHLVNERMKKEVANQIDYNVGGSIKTIFRDDIPKRTDTAKNPMKKSEIKHTLYGKQEGKCNGCNTHFEFRHFHIDHVIPKSKGGADGIENFQLLCGHCNQTKSSNDMAYLRKKLKDAKIIP